MNRRIRMQIRALVQHHNPDICAIVNGDDGLLYVTFVRSDDWDDFQQRYGDRIDGYF